MAALPTVSTDMALPALTLAGQSLHATADQAGLTLSLLVAGFAVGPVVHGLLADWFGRRPFLLAGLVLFAAGGRAASLAPPVGLLLVARLVQGAGPAWLPPLPSCTTSSRDAPSMAALLVSLLLGRTADRRGVRSHPE